MDEVKENTEEVKESGEKTESDKKPISNKPRMDFSSFFKKNWFWILVVLLLAAILILNISLRTQNVEQLKDVTTGKYTLGPDLDPFLYLRLAKEIVGGTLTNPDLMVHAPLGWQNYASQSMAPWIIVFVYRVLDLFLTGPKATLEFAAVISPVIFFSLSIIVFFLFVFSVFSFNMSKKKSAIIALIASLFYVVVPEMLHRTVAGIPELESFGVLWFWTAFLFFTLAWKSGKLKTQIILGLLSGVFTGLMIFTWGGFRYIFMGIGLTGLLIFFFNKEKKKNLLIFSSWFISALIFSSIKSGLFASLRSVADMGFCFVILLIMILDTVLFNTKLKNIKEKIRLPESVISLLIMMVLGVLALLIFAPSFLGGLFSSVIGGLLHPFGEGRIGLTVAENNAPYFSQVFGSFGWIFWFFFFGVILLFYFVVKDFDKNKKWWFFALFVIFLVTFIFSRISPSSTLNGDNTISKILYFGGLLVFLLFSIITYIRAYAKKDEKTLDDFKKIPFNYLLLLALSIWMIVSMRGAIRLFFIISPFLIILAAYLPVKIYEISEKTKETTYKVLIWCIVLLAAILLIVTFVNFEKSTQQQAQYTVNGAYYEQWQKAMSWVREETPEGSIFAHWWDYGYWVQTLGERPSVTDGGHINSFWDHTTARYLMTAQNEKTALQLCKAHNVSYFLLDSTDIGKYSAFASIGSDSTGKDRLSWVSTFYLDEKQIQETKNETIYVYTGGTMLDQDITWRGIFFPMQKAGIGAFLFRIDKNTQTITEVDAIFIYKNQQYQVPIKYLWINGQIRQFDTKDAITSMFYVLPSITQTGLNNLGGGLYLSEKALKTQWVRLYLLDQTENFELVHSEPSLYVKQLKEVYNLSIGDFVLAGDFQGPIKIWKVNYPQDIGNYSEYLQKISPEGHWAELDYLGV